jgi:hypothetical protein
MGITGSERCEFWQGATALGDAGAVAVWWVGGGPQTAMTYMLGTVPLTPMFWANSFYPDYFSFLPFFGFQNVTLSLDYPGENPLYQREGYIGGSLSVIQSLGITLSVLLLMWSVYRWTGFFILMNQIFSLPSVILALNIWLAGFILFQSFTLNFFGGIFFGTNLVRQVGDFFEIWVWQICSTQIILLGFYLGEVANITSVQRVPGLDKLKIPAAIVIALLWAATLASQGVEAWGNGPTGGVREFQITVFVICWTACAVVAFWGSITLLLSAAKGGSSKKILVISILTMLCCVILLACAICYLVMKNYALEIVVKELDPRGIQVLSELELSLLIFGPSVIGGVFCILFRTETQKEIEMSKSGTSSTSSSAGSSKSSSSSATNDPVIEL